MVSAHLWADRIEAISQGSGAVLIGSECGPPCGVVALSWSPSLEVDAPIARITTLLVAQDARRRGIGRLLLKAAAHSARLAKCGSLSLTVPPDHPDLEAFGHATGFVASGAVFERALRKRA